MQAIFKFNHFDNNSVFDINEWMSYFYNKHLLPTIHDKIIDEWPIRSVNIYIDIKSNFLEDVVAFTHGWNFKIISIDNIKRMQQEFNFILQKYREYGFLFLESEMFFKNKENFYILKKEINKFNLEEN
jgi:hypothetical protein